MNTTSRILVLSAAVVMFTILAAALPVNACAETSLAGVPALLVRTAEFSVPSLRIYVAWELGEDVWERLLDAGRNRGLIPLGLDSLHQLRCVAPSV